MPIISNPALPRVIESNVSRLSFPSFILFFFHLRFIFRQKDSIFVKALDFLRLYSAFCFSFVPFVPVWVFNHMILWAAPSLSHVGDNLGPLVSSPSQIATSFYSFSPLNGSPVSSSSIFRLSPVKNRIRSVVCAASNANNRPLTGVLFEPFEEVKKELDLVPTVPQLSIARHKYSEECEAAVNEQINVEYNVSYAYHAMFAYFDRDNVALKGLAKLFKESSDEERNHAEKLMKYQNKRGGKVKLQSIVMPLSEFDHPEKGDALYAMELALSLEKLTNDRLLNLHAVADRNGDVQLCEFVESEFLTMQVESIKKISEYVAQLRRVGKGHGVWHFDQMLLHEEAAV